MSCLSILGATILLLGLFSPAAISYSRNPSRFILINNLLAFILYGMSIHGDIDQDINSHFGHPITFVNGIFLFIVMFVCCISIYLTSLKFRLGKMDFQKYRMVSLNNAFLLIAASFFWLLLMSVDFDLAGENFWRLYFISFGIMAPFITATLIFVEFLINRSKLEQKKRTYRYNLPFTSMGIFLVLLETWAIMYSPTMNVFLGLLVVYLLLVALLIFIGVLTVYSNPKKAYYILIVALVLSGFMLILLSTIIPIRNELNKSSD